MLEGTQGPSKRRPLCRHIDHLGHNVQWRHPSHRLVELSVGKDSAETISGRLRHWPLANGAVGAAFPVDR